MRITSLESIRLGEFPNILFVRLHTDAGLVGLGETFFGAYLSNHFVYNRSYVPSLRMVSRAGASVLSRSVRYRGRISLMC